jgi:hypothetical protein
MLNKLSQFAWAAFASGSMTVDVPGMILGLAALIGFFWLGWWFLSRSLYRNLEEKDPWVQVGQSKSQIPAAAGLCTDGVQHVGLRKQTANQVCFSMHLQALWSLVFTFSCNMLLLILLEIMAIMSHG